MGDATSQRTAEAGLRELLALRAPPHAKLVDAVRKALRKRLPTAYEVVYGYTDSVVISFSPDERGYEGVLAIRAGADGVKLYFNRGKGLPDPEKLLRGSGKLVRYVDVESAATLAHPAVANLVVAAIARSDTPFARSGGGEVVIRTPATKPAASKRKPSPPRPKR